LIQKGRRFIERNQAAIERVLEAFGGRLAKDLELVSTIAYLRRHAPAEKFENNKKLAAHVKALKPKYTDKEIAKAIEEVRGFLTAEEAA
jgi:hypothetical protein